MKNVGGDGQAGGLQRGMLSVKKSPGYWSEKVREDGQAHARPSLLIFRNKQERDNLLELAPRLHKAKGEYWR